MLERRGVQLTPQALVNALLDPRAVVRSLAAEKLAQDQQRDAIPEMLAALFREQASGTREIMAFAAASLGEAQGYDTLRSICTGTGGAVVLRMNAAQDLFRLHDEGCVDDFLRLIRARSSSLDFPHDEDVTVGLGAFNVFQFKHLSASQKEKIRDLAAQALISRVLRRLLLPRR
jgi:hypothetical protein